MQSTTIKQNLNSGSLFAQTQNETITEKSRKRPYSKPCPKSRKKNRVQSPSFNDEETNLDNDLLGLAGSINTDKNLDSDSSNEDFFELNDTIIVDDNIISGPQSNLSNNVNSFKEKNATAFFNNTLNSYVSTDGSKHQTITIEKKKGVKLKSTVDNFKEIMPSSASKNNSQTSSALVSNVSLDKSNNNIISKISKGAKKKKTELLEDNHSKVETVQSSISNDYSFPSNMCQSSKTLNHQSIYASMGLDEDLCDTEQTSNKTSNVTFEEINKTSTPEKFDNISNVKIKTEKILPPSTCHDDKKVSDKNENLTLDGYHVSWTFEAEPPCDDGEDEEEVPLLLLKNTKTTAVNSQKKMKSNNLNHEIPLNSNKMNVTTDNNINNFPPSLFIKKELIDDEITSQSQAISSNHLSLNSNTKNNLSTNLPVKIKSEPIDAEHFYDNSTKSNISLSSFNSQFSSCSSTGLSEKSMKKQKQNISKPVNPTDYNKHSRILSTFPDEKSMLVNSTNEHSSSITIDNASACSSAELSGKSPMKKQKQNTSKTANTTDSNKFSRILSRLLQDEKPSSSVSSRNKHVSSNVVVDNASINKTQISQSALSDSRKPVVKNSIKGSKRKKKPKAIAANVTKGLENINQFAAHAELSETLPTPDSTESISSKPSLDNTNNFNNLDASSNKILDIPKAVTIRQTKIKIKPISKKSDLENILQSTPDLKMSTTDNTTFEIQEKNSTDSDTSIEIDILTNSPDTEKGKEEDNAGKNLDENEPITLLIKRQKSDTDTDVSDTFLCTNITGKSSTVESHSVYGGSQENNLNQCDESSFLPDKVTNSDILPSEASAIPQNIKKKKCTKKKLSKKKPKQKSSSVLTENHSMLKDLLSSTSVKEVESNSLIHTSLEKPLWEKNKVRKGKGSPFNSESATVKGFTDLPSQNNWDAQNEESLSSNSFQTSFSGDINQSEINNLNSLPTAPKKRKRVRRSNGWYKKKKTKKERERSKKNVTIANEVEIKNPVSGTINDPLLLTAIKTPVVVIKNLSSEIHKVTKNPIKVIDNTSKIESVENNSAKVNSEYLDEVPINSVSKSQKTKRNKSCKKIASQTSKKNSIQNDSEETLSGSEYDNTSKQCNTEVNCLVSESPISEINSENYSSEIINESNINSSHKKDVTVENVLDNDEVIITGSKDNSTDSNLTFNSRGTLFPSLNIQELAKEIEAFEALIENQSSQEINTGNLIQNISRSDPKTVKIPNEDNSITLIKDTRKNLPELSVEESYVKYFNSDPALSNVTSVQSGSNISIKQELINCSSKNNQTDSSQLHPFRTALQGQESITTETTRNSMPPLISIKKEKDIDSQSLHKNVTSEYTSASNRIAGLTDRLNPVENINKVNIPNSNTSLNTSQNSNHSDINSIGLSIKREVTRITKSVSNNTHSFRDQNDLIQKIHASSSKPAFSSSCIADSKKNSEKDYPSDSESDCIPEIQKKSLEFLNDEIQIIPKESTPKSVLCIDITDDDDNLEQGSHDKISEYDAITNISSEFIELSKRIKTEKDNSKTNSVVPEASIEIAQTSDSSKQISSAFSFLKSDQIQSSVDPSKVRTDILDSNFSSTGSYVSEDPIKRETNNPFIVRDKYIDEYFKHPFPPTLVSYKKRRNRSKIYERIDSKAWNLSIDEVESRLKHSENTLPQFGKKLGDIIKLEKYPVSKSEVECYHRILGVAPSHKLLSKCYLTSNQKFLTVINNEFNKFEQPKLQTKEANNLTINDILQGINESKMMCRNFDSEKDSTGFDRDCPSAETKDSFDSSISHSTDKCVNVITDKNIEQSNLASIRGNEFNSLSANAILTSQNSSISCISNFEDASNNVVSNVDISVNTPSDSDVSSIISSNEVSNLSYLQNNNILANLNLPSKEVVNNILNSTETNHSTTFEIPDITTNSNTELNNTTMNTTVNNESSLSSNFSHVESEVSSEIITTVPQTSINTNKIFDLINMPVVELRKILITASSLPSTSNDNNILQSDNVNNSISQASNVNCDSLLSDNGNRDGIWKNKETFEYNHTQSIPITDADSIQDKEIQESNDCCSESIKDNEEETRNENSDDEYVDNEPIHYDSDERNDSSSQENEETEKPAPIPQYKSKWEKIMERKSQELKEKEKLSELYFKECVPVSSSMKPQNKRNSIQNKTSQSVEKQLEKSEEKQKVNIKKKKSENDKNRQIESKSKTGTNVEKINKSQKISKKSDKQISKTNETEITKKESALKNKGKKSDEIPNLFAPDKLVKSPVKKPSTTNLPSKAKSNEKNNKRFYGNRVTNRGTFLTEANPLTKIKIPKKTLEGTKKLSNVRSEEFHSMVKSPDIDLPRVSSGKKFNKSVDARKNSEEYKSPLSNASRTVTPHFIRTKQMRDRQNEYYNSRSHFMRKNDSYTKKDALLPTPYPKSSLHSNDEIVPNRNPNLQTLSNHPQNENSLGQKIPLLSSPPSNPSHLSSDTFQCNVDPTKALLQKIMSVFQTNPNVADDNRLPNSENVDAAWNSSQYNSPYGVSEPSVTQNINLQSSLSVDSATSVSNPFRNLSQVDSLNLSRTAVGSPPNMNLTFNSVPPINTSLADSLDPRRAALGLQSNMPSTSVMSGNSTLTDILDPRRAALGLASNMSVSASSLDPRRTAVHSQPNMPVIQSNPSLINIPLSDHLDPRKAALPMHQISSGKKHPETPLSIGSQILNSPPYVAPMTSASQQVPRKATCLVPSHLKTLVGHKTVETHNVQLLMLEWSVDWLIQQQKVKDPPPISNALRKVTSSYDSFEDYYNTYFPLMLLETWQRIYVSWTHLNQTAPFLCQIISYSVKKHYVSVECQTVFSSDYRRKGVHPDEGSILMVKYSTKSNEYTIKILGYVTHVKTRRYNPVTDSKICSSLPQQKDVNPDSLQILTLTFMGAYNSEDIDKRQPVRIHVLCTVKHNLKQNDAMLYINKSPLQRSILNPVADGLLTVSLTPRNSPEDKVNECVRDITKGILSPHPLPLLTIVRAKPESDRLNIIPLLIQKMKTAYKTKVLLCVRTVRALGDIAANICLQQSLKLVIVNKRCDTNLQFQKYLLDELVACEAKKVEEGNNLKSDGYIKIKKQIIRDCDVILSLIRNSHDEFLDTTFHETESIAQMCCIVDEANLCTEPETLIPILHGISKLILIGDPDYTAKVLSKPASAYDFNQSFFQRAYDLDLLTE